MIIEQEQEREVLDLLFDGLLCVDRDGRIVGWNTAAENLTGFDRAEIIGARCTADFLRHRGARKGTVFDGSPILATLEDGLKRAGEVRLATKYGYMITVVMRTSRLYDRSGRIAGAAEVFNGTSIEQHRMHSRVCELERMATLDSLLEIPNRRFLSMILEARFSAWERYRRSFGIVMMDIDRFKRINDTYGHLAGDEALKLVANALTNSVRAFDVVGRWGGEEFLAVVDVTMEGRIECVADRFRCSLKCLELDERLPVRLTLSAGATIIREGDTIESLLCRADGRVYDVKARGGDDVCASCMGDAAQASTHAQAVVSSPGVMNRAPSTN